MLANLQVWYNGPDATRVSVASDSELPLSLPMQKTLQKIPILILIVLFLAELYVLLSPFWWGFELFSHYIVYFATAELLLLPLLLLKKKSALVLLLALFLSMHAAQIAPYLKTKDAPSEDLKNPETDFKIFSHNFNFNNTNYDQLFSQIQEVNPDFFVILEASDFWEKPLPYEIQNEYPYSAKSTVSGPFGIFMASRHPTDFQEIRLGVFPALEATVEIDEKNIRVIGMHPIPPYDVRMAQDRNDSFEALANHVQKSPVPTLVAGDFNSTPWSPYFQKLLKDSGLTEARLGFGILPTWNARSFWLKIPIDHILVSPEIRTVRFDTGAETGSDHLPVLATMNLP